MNKVLAFLLICTFTAGAFWSDITKSVKSPHINMVTVKGADNIYVQLDPAKSVFFPVSSRMAIKWIISTDSFATISIYKYTGNKDSALITQNVSRGSTPIRLFCEPDNYRIVTTAPVRGRLFIWQNPSMSPLVPVGGGIPVYLQTEDTKTEPYYHVAPDAPAILRVQGPAIAYIYVRSYAGISGKPTELEFEVTQGTAPIIQKVIQSLPSSEVAFVKSLVGIAPSKATLIKIAVPRGIHEYSARSINNKAIIKFYLKTTTRILPGEGRTPVLGRNKNNTDENTFTSVQPIQKTPFKLLSLTAQAGVRYDNNIYLYGTDKIDSFPPIAGKEYRYPRVESIDDFLYPLDFRALFRYKQIQIRGNLGGELFSKNNQLNAFNYTFALGYTGPYFAEIAYSATPYKALRPTYDAPSKYTMLSVSSQRCELLIRLKNTWNPELQISMGTSRYNDRFDYLDAFSLGATVGVERNFILGSIRENILNIASSIGGGEMIALKETITDTSDRTNTFFVANFSTSIDLKAFTIGFKSGVLTRNYTSQGITDGNKGRYDLEYSLVPFVQYTRNGIVLTADFFTLDGRNVQSNEPDDETSKSYLSVSGGLRASFNIRPFDWLRS